MTCNAEFDAKKVLSESRPNKVAQRMLDAERHLSDEEKYLKHSLDDNIVNLHLLSDEFARFKLSLDAEFQHHFCEIKRKIETRRDELKAKIEEISVEMLNACLMFEVAYAHSFQRQIERVKVNKYLSSIFLSRFLRF
jgi:hypothetical protein